MRHRPESYYPSTSQVGRTCNRPPPRTAAAAHAAQFTLAQYTLAYAGYQLRLGPIAFWATVGTLVIMAAWTIITATYFAFRDDVLTSLIARQAEMQFGYEDRIAELRAQVDRMSSRQLLDQEQFEHKLDAILRRQTMLEQRANTLSTLPDLGITGAIRPTGRAERPALGKPAPINEKSAPPAAPGRKAAIGNVDGVLTRLGAALDHVEAEQSATLAAIESSYDLKARRIRGVLTELGIDAGKSAPSAEVGATGGPFVAARLRSDSSAFERQLHRIGLARAHVDQLNRTLGNVPVRRPVTGEIDPSSGFGVRIDPFLKSPAMHTGLDMRGEPGDPVRATANGTVTFAGWQGGYGNMIEIDHGNGVSTRYGHLSSIDTEVGKTVKTGQVIGKVGTTGRSTGPHLHYETRIDGEAVDPQRFLRAGAKLGAAW
jgi:murein DD-endopeptidase MepM/ murein hydrolase activator NlpD